MVTIYGFDLGEVQTLFGIFSSISIGLAAVAYIDKKRQDTNLSVVDAVSFFRKEIIDESDKFIKLTKLSYPEYQFPRIKLDIQDIKYVKENYPQEFQKQTNFCKIINNHIGQVLILNRLEEFSLRIKYLDILNHDAMIQLKTPFIQFAEMFACSLLWERQVSTGLPTYQVTIETYLKWMREVDGTTVEERLKAIQ